MIYNTKEAMLGVLIFLLVSVKLVAQDSVKPKKPVDRPTTTTAPAKKEEAPSTAKEGDKGGVRDVTYLDLVHSREKTLKLKEDNMRDIQLLNALTAAMPEAVDKGASEQIGNEYKDALKLIYRQDYVNAEKTLRANRENIATAMGKASEVLRKRTTEMLNQSADRMADLEMQAENTGSAEAIRMAGVVQRNQHRLAVGYQQLTLATTAERHRRYAEALAHYRLARLHAIYLQIELAKDENEKNSLRAKYRNELDEKRPAKDDVNDKDTPPAKK